VKDDFEFSQWELEQLKRLPPLHQQFAEQYPASIRNVLDRLDSPPLPEGYQPKWIDFYYFDGASVRGTDVSLPAKIVTVGFRHGRADDCWLG
jgi:hypothetical protein